MKLIFLDIDGVLVCRRPGVFEEGLLRNLQSLAQQAGCDIVLSTDWRRHPAARDEARNVLASLGLKVIGCTPRLSPFVAQRPTEILQWKRDYTKRPGVDPITHWIAIDDRCLLEERHGQYLRGHFLHTHPLRGLTEERVQEGMRLLSLESAAQPHEAASDEVPNLDTPGQSTRGGAAGSRRGLSSGAPRGRGSAPPNSMAQALAAARAKSSSAGGRTGGIPPTAAVGPKAPVGMCPSNNPLLPSLSQASTGPAASIPVKPAPGQRGAGGPRRATSNV